ncbi:MAG: cell wall hydrolase [Rhodopila sp.]
MDSDTDALSDQEIIAKTVYGESRGESYEGQRAVACVILNRASKPGWWGRTPREVCLCPWQFSCWNSLDPNRPIILAVSPKDPIYAQCLTIAAEALAGDLPDVTHGADSYRRMGTPASWANGLTPVATIGHHEFFVTVLCKVGEFPSA